MRHLIRLLTLAAALHAGQALAGPPVDINTATAEDLAATIAGVGMTKARAIVEYRDRHGPFATVDDLTAVRGIGERTIEGSRDALTVAEPAP